MFGQGRGGPLHIVRRPSNLSDPKRLRLEKRGTYFYMSLAHAASESPQIAGGSIRVPIQGDFYVGIGVCSHERDIIEKAVFSNVDLSPLAASNSEPSLYSTLETINIASTDRRVVYVSPGKFEAPNWTRDGSALRPVASQPRIPSA